MANEQSHSTSRTSPLLSPGTRRLLLVAGPLAFLLGASTFYFWSGRYVTTDNAYIQTDTVIISSEVSGPITEVKVQENMVVDQGTPLCQVDPRPYTLSAANADAKLQEVQADIRTTKARYRQKLLEQDLARSDLAFAERELQRRMTLAKQRAVSEAKLDIARHDRDVARQRLAIIEEELDQILATLEGDPDAAPDTLATYRLAATEQQQAVLDLEHTVLRAPFTGVVSKVPQPGKHVAPGTAVMALVGSEGFWIDANFKETALTHVRPGQLADIEVDTYPGMVLHGKVDSISPATGSSFSVLPAQNATGNWVKVVQRIPVRIHIVDAPPSISLRSGMSASVRIDTGHQRSLPASLHWMLSVLHLENLQHDDSIRTSA